MCLVWSQRADRQAGRQAGHKQDALPGAQRGPRDITLKPRPQACIRKQHYEELHLLRPQKRSLGAFQEDVHMRFRRAAQGMTLVINIVILGFPLSLLC